MSQGKLIGIATRQQSRGQMCEFDQIGVSITLGCEGDFRGKPGGRQVTVLSREAWESACNDLGQSLPWTARRANLLVEGIELADTTSSILSIGNVQLEITYETEPCRRMTQVAKGLREALTPTWRGGVCCRVLHGGQIRLGDVVTLDVRLDA